MSFLGATALLGLAAAALTVSAATTRWVTSTNDSGPGTLREALELAQTGDTILFDPGVFPTNAPATIFVSNGLPAITQGGLTIDASDAGGDLGREPDWHHAGVGAD